MSKAYVGICLLCGGVLKHDLETDEWICLECGEVFDPDEVGFMDEMPPNIYRGEQLMNDDPRNSKGKGKTGQ